MKQHTTSIAFSILALIGTSAYAQSSSAPAASTAVKPNPLSQLSPRTGFDYFSGHAKSNHNHPIIYAYQGDIQKLVVIGRGYREEFPISQTEQAFKAYRALLKKTRYKVDDPHNGRSPFISDEKN